MFKAPNDIHVHTFCLKSKLICLNLGLNPEWLYTLVTITLKMLQDVGLFNHRSFKFTDWANIYCFFVTANILLISNPILIYAFLCSESFILSLLYSIPLSLYRSLSHNLLSHPSLLLKHSHVLPVHFPFNETMNRRRSFQ